MSIERLRKLAGLHLLESAHEESEEDNKPAAPNPFGNIASQISKAADKATAKAAKKSEKKEDGEPVKKRGRAESEKVSKFREWVKNNPQAKRADALQYANTIGMNWKHANERFYKIRASLKEYWIIANPEDARVLAEGSRAANPTWVDFESVDTFDAEIYTTESQAQGALRTLMTFGINSVMIKVDDSLTEADDEDSDNEEDQENILDIAKRGKADLEKEAKAEEEDCNDQKSAKK